MIQVPQQTMEPVQIQVPRMVPQETTVMVPQTTTEMVATQVPRTVMQEVQTVQQPMTTYQQYQTVSEPRYMPQQDVHQRVPPENFARELRQTKLMFQFSSP